MVSGGGDDGGSCGGRGWCGGMHFTPVVGPVALVV